MKTRELIYLAIIVFAFSMYGRSCDRIAESNRTITALTDSIRITQNTLGQYETEKAAIVLSSMKQLIELENLTGTNKRLQNIVNRQKGTIAAITANAKTEIVYVTDSVETKIDSVGNPTFTKLFHDEWKKGSVSMNKDSLYLSVSVKNKFDFSVRRERNLFGPDEYFVHARSLNPNTYVDGLSGITIKGTPKRWHIGPMIGYGFTGQGNISTFVGAGVMFGIVSF